MKPHEKKFIVFEKSLLSLFASCPICAGPASILLMGNCSHRARSWAYRTISENMSQYEIGQQSLFLIVFKMAALLVKMQETVKHYIDSSENQPLATEISGELLQLSRDVIKKHTFDGERAYKFHLAQPARMLSRSFAYWHKTILRKMK